MALNNLKLKNLTDARKLFSCSKKIKIISKNMTSVQKIFDPTADLASQPSQPGEMPYKVEYMTQKARELSAIAKGKLIEEARSNPLPDGQEMDRDQLLTRLKPLRHAEPSLFILDEIEDPKLGHKRTSETFRIPQTPPDKRSKKFHHFNKENINPRIGSPEAPQSAQTKVKIQQMATQRGDRAGHRYSLLDLWS
jgi:hypothetical protein